MEILNIIPNKDGTNVVKYINNDGEDHIKLHKWLNSR
jgi:hypothetical protein